MRIFSILIFVFFVFVGCDSAKKEQNAPMVNKKSEALIPHDTFASIELINKPTSTKYKLIAEYITQPLSYDWPQRGYLIQHYNNIFGKPNNITAKAIENRHEENQIDTIYVINYGDIVINLYRNTKYNYELLASCEFITPRYKLRNTAISVGTNINNVLSFFGKPDTTTSSSISYFSEPEDLGAEDYINDMIFAFSKDTIKLITFVYYMD